MSQYVAVDEMEQIVAICKVFDVMWETVVAQKAVSIDIDVPFGGVDVFDSNGEKIGKIAMHDGGGFGLYFPESDVYETSSDYSSDWTKV